MLANLIKFLDPSVKHWDLMGQNQNVRTAVRHALCFNICTLATLLNRYDKLDLGKL
ncbi:hypothetical protein [Wolbachia endosymbiont (group A) of Anomoia purmunda]|uniref:hypothetical protein n=1 Tax=Wolbachia endosymbiont (group A) of Anomoia purmunda TaxID=2953978 RepID=UPI00222E4CB0|nr:hypothetical protein [Wolbachia endosymbiont (group A) of Anomoia purmunda]